MPYFAIAHQQATRLIKPADSTCHPDAPYGTATTHLDRGGRGSLASLHSWCRRRPKIAPHEVGNFLLYRKVRQMVLEEGGLVELGAGWRVTLPAAHYQMNANGSWSAWGTDWAMDMRITEISCAVPGTPAGTPNALDSGWRVAVSGEGWVGHKELLLEFDGRRTLHSLAAQLVAGNTAMSCSVSCFAGRKADSAEELLHAIVHRPSTGLLTRLFGRKAPRA